MTPEEIRQLVLRIWADRLRDRRPGRRPAHLVFDHLAGRIAADPEMQAAFDEDLVDIGDEARFNGRLTWRHARGILDHNHRRRQLAADPPPAPGI